MPRRFGSALERYGYDIATNDPRRLHASVEGSPDIQATRVALVNDRQGTMVYRRCAYDCRLSGAQWRWALRQAGVIVCEDESEWPTVRWYDTIEALDEAWAACLDRLRAIEEAEAAEQGDDY